ncbi:MAG: DNA polymerase III subunit delta' [Polaromonas sp.]|uniref:DNA polymerase III subunit delta' n=1 Tax=Polaromonas sp. TaxID=1869339 RepID=UPI002718A784|nr:DNA polymerase III subunit delta' [Polaromonas sp.]MDO9114819.1 DNA polymerase III subunit delta' [Polaromonas sp.]MDP1887624.1 DNA polymerase III subunit delta' [Polaromonas sp.]
MSSDSVAARPPLAPWLQTQLQTLLAQRGHAWLLSGPSGLGQFDLALALARAWLCEQATAQGACGVCGSCHAVDVHTHADLCMLMPETLSLALGWPLDEKTQDDLDSKKRKPSKEIKVDAAREAVTFTQFTRSRGSTKVVLVYPAERMNAITANTLLKTLEEPPGAVQFILATEAAHQLLPTIRSRCQGHTMHWPDFAQALAWLAERAGPEGKAGKLPAAADLHTLLAAAGGRPADALERAQAGPSSATAQHWQALPKAMARGEVGALSDFGPAQAVDALQKLCHDMLATRAGAEPRFFRHADLPVQPAGKPGAAGAGGGPGFAALGAWAKELAATARTVEHPYNPGLMLEALVSRAQLALNSK